MTDPEATGIARSHRVDHWLYRGGRPNGPARALNRVWAALYAAGVRPNRLVTLRVPGRRTGRVISFPLVVADHQGERYLVAMLGTRTNWVHNARAAGGRAELRHGRRESVLLEDVAPGGRAPILRRYLACSPGGRAHFPVGAEAPLEDFERIAERYPVFRVVRVHDDGT